MLAFITTVIDSEEALTSQLIEKDDNGNVVANPVGDKCKVFLDFYAKDEGEAQLYCERWGRFVLSEWGRDVDNRVHCTYENVYECSNNYEQIRGMCYQQFYELNTYEEAEKTCEDSVSGAVILKIQSKNHGELLEAYYPGDLTMYFVQPDKTLELSSLFVGSNSTEAEDQNKNYVILFNYGIHYDVGPNTIIKLDKTVKAFAMCMYQPPETILSFAAKAKKLGVLYHSTQLVGAMGVWRTASHYTPSNIPGYPDSHSDTCEASMKAILGTSDGTLLNLKPANTKLFNEEVKKSFNRAFGPFAYCDYWTKHRQQDYLVREVYFNSKETRGRSCPVQANLLESDYNANWKRNLRPFKYSFVFYPQNVSNSLSFEAFPHAIHSPMLCGLHYLRDEHKANPICPTGWLTYERTYETICHRKFDVNLDFDRGFQWCRDNGYEMSRWDTYNEYSHLLQFRIDSGGRDPYVKCTSVYGCTNVQWKDGRKGGDLRSGGLSTYSSPQEVMCEKRASEFN
ncbi:unnamed protein product [Caenorhabditis angaria]|uniref:C-type lectin domain-containing protein n=1 Tax=Caenorhabditis angaria TaxID=860376 RepID=A0A9P1IB49_9PELO|nr:unnamed protein product [Caenorhabditis angaria]